jgi:hypothetical protein
MRRSGVGERERKRSASQQLILKEMWWDSLAEDVNIFLERFHAQKLVRYYISFFFSISVLFFHSLFSFPLFIPSHGTFLSFSNLQLHLPFSSRQTNLILKAMSFVGA